MTFMNAKVTRKRVIMLIVIVLLTFALCMSDKTLVGILIVVPVLFLYVAIPAAIGHRLGQWRDQRASMDTEPPREEFD